MRRTRAFILIRVPVCLCEELLIDAFHLSANVTEVAHDGFVAVFHLGVAIDVRRANTIRNPIAVQEIVFEIDLWSIISLTVFRRGNRVILIAVLVLQCQKTAALALFRFRAPGTSLGGGTHFTGLMHPTGIGFESFCGSDGKHNNGDQKKHQDE
jgi:hypothetical protein